MTSKKRDAKQLVLDLLKADTEEDAIAVLKVAGLWDNPSLWRHYGDKESNYSQIGAQQAQPDSALTEKITNAIDSRLMGMCQASGIDPESAQAPTSILDAVARFFGAGSSFGPGNSFVDWSDQKRTVLARGLTVAVTGGKQRPSITITDDGEGQRPDRIPYTFVSLDRQNKARVHFVQGK